MKILKTILLIISIIHLHSCAEYKTDKTLKKQEKQYFLSKGFALIYENNFYKQKIVNKKINNKNLEIIHSFLKVNTPIKIINPDNSKFVESKIYKKGDYPKIFNIVISEKIASILELDKNNPYVEIIEIKKNKTFIAKEGNTFEEERNVAEKAPIDEIIMDDLTKEKIKPKLQTVKKYNFILVISDFYFEDSAKNLKEELAKKTKMNNISVKKINNNKYRLFVGPFRNFNALKTSYISLNNLGFESLNVYKE